MFPTASLSASKEYLRKVKSDTSVEWRGSILCRAWGMDTLARDNSVRALERGQLCVAQSGSRSEKKEVRKGIALAR